MTPPVPYSVHLAVTGPGGTDTETKESYITVRGSSFIPVDGIWKSLDSALSLYLQTYEAGSCVLVVTMGNGIYSPFIDSDYADGISSDDDVDGHGYGLRLDLADTSHGTLTVTLQAFGEVVTQVELRFAANGGPVPITPHGGIWKSGDGLLSFYLQNYQTGSCVLVATVGDGTYLAFLDEDYTDGITCSNDVDNQGHTMSLALTDSNHGMLTLTFPSSQASIPVECKFPDIQ